MALQKPGEPDPWEQFQQEILSDLDSSKKALNEITMMLEQSQAELAKLSQRNAAINAHLQQIQNQFDSAPRADIRMAYSAAIDAQQRLLVMRGQLEKLQSDQSNLKRFVTSLEKIQNFLVESGKVTQDQGKSNLTMLEMMINAQEGERKRLSRQMHDGPAQALSNFIVQAEIAGRMLDLDPSKAKEELNNLKGSAMGTFQQVREFIFELRPMMLDDLGLFPTLKRYVDSFRERSGLDVTLNIKGQERRLESYIEVMIFRALQELLGNAAKHNQNSPTKVQVNIAINIDEKLVKVTVSDNGKGFDPVAVLNMGGIGLKLIRERVEMVGGYMEIDSAIGQGSKISFQVPSLEESHE